MSNGESKARSVVLSYFPMFIATLSLVTSIFNGYLNNKFVDIIQRNFGRAEYMRTCKEIIDAYFQVKFRAGLVSERAAGTADRATATIDARNAVMRFAALGTYLANLRDEASRARYTELTHLLEKAVAEAGRAPPGDVGKLFEQADTIFAEMNAECVKSAKE
jgi:hypothetical protein